MDQVGPWIAGLLVCLVLSLLFDVVVTGFLGAIFSTGWGKRGRRVSAKLTDRFPHAVRTLIGPLGEPGVSGTWYDLVVDEAGLTAYRATGRVAWVEPWSGIRWVGARFGTLVIDRRDDAPRTISPKKESGADVEGAELAELAQRILAQRPTATTTT